MFCLNQTDRWKVESLSPDVEISVFTMYSGNGFFFTLARSVTSIFHYCGQIRFPLQSFVDILYCEYGKHY